MRRSISGGPRVTAAGLRAGSGSVRLGARATRPQAYSMGAKCGTRWPAASATRPLTRWPMARPATP